MVYYFAYGSNLNQNDLDAYCKKHSRSLIDLKSRSPKGCLLRDFKLNFNYYSKGRGGGVANIEHVKGEHVEGVLFSLSPEDEKTIDRKEGAPDYYHEIPVTITLRDGTIVGKVKTYIVCEEKKQSHFVPPTANYKQIIVDGAGAFGLTGEWIERLEKIPCTH